MAFLIYQRKTQISSTRQIFCTAFTLIIIVILVRGLGFFFNEIKFYLLRRGEGFLVLTT